MAEHKRNDPPEHLIYTLPTTKDIERRLRDNGAWKDFEFLVSKLGSARLATWKNFPWASNVSRTGNSYTRVHEQKNILFLLLCIVQEPARFDTWDRLWGMDRRKLKASFSLMRKCAEQLKTIGSGRFTRYVFEKDQRGNAADAVFHGNVGGAIHVQLPYA